ncbi:MAG: hypothetical protein LBH20_04940 [Treponema sp.]|jgi:hypothetical protein|nr:hypothetical protein [Treponema sp.]
MRSVLMKLCLFVFLCAPLCAQTHVSVPVESQVYYILEQAELKGLCSPLSGVRPYSQNIIVKAIKEILATENTKKLSDTEREILGQYLDKFTKPKNGIDWQKGKYHSETTITKKEIPLSLNVGANVSMEGSAGLYPAFNERYYGTEIWLRFYLNGDMGSHVSWEFSGEGGLMKAPRKKLGTYNTYYKGFVDHEEYRNQELIVYSEPLTHFPYAYKKRWDASIHPLGSLSSFESWPDSLAGAYNLLSEISASFLEDKLSMRLGRLSHEWGSVPYGSSLGLNQTARPFLGIEAEFRPFTWFSIATMTGFLEFFNTQGEKKSGMTSQNAYSTTLFQFKFKDYVSLDIGEGVIWPKRLELGYMSPITNTIFYKNNVGDFDNMAAMLNLKVQYPGIGNVWASLFWDEAFWVSNWYELDRSMLAGQLGMSFSLPFLSFSSVKLSYTRVNPYCYTHTRTYVPWYGERPMEQAYTNNGVCLGYYIPPNSDEILVKFQTMPIKSLTTHLQYQLIRHGANYGSSAVDGSSLLSELDPQKRDGSNPILKRYFLHDGAYQWNHIIKLGVEWNLPRLPVSLFGEGGAIISYFTNTKEEANSGKAYPYEKIDTPEYPQSTGFVVSLGVKVFPR